MGALRSVMGAKTLKPLSKTETMRLIAGSRRDAAGPDAFLQYLKDNPKIAEQLGKVTARMRSNFAQAYPGETREATFSTDEWETAGYKHVAELNKAMKISAS